MTDVPEAASWQFDCLVTLTEAELGRLAEIAWQRKLAGRGNAAGWRLFVAAMALGFAVALVAVLTHAARPGDAGVIAVSAFLACWAAMELSRRSGARVQRRLQSDAWNSVDFRYALTAGPAGVRAAFPHHRGKFDWASFSGADTEMDFVLLWTRHGRPIGIPLRCLPPDWTPAGLVERARSCIGQATNQAS